MYSKYDYIIKKYIKGVKLEKRTKPRTPKGVAIFSAQVAEEKKADNIVVLDMTSIEFSPTDYFVVCSCDSDSQIKAIVDEVMRLCHKLGMQKPKVEGLSTGYWVILDYFDTVFHIMHRDARKFYQIEKIWGDAYFNEVNPEGLLRKAKNLEFLNN